jgi:putative transposase
MDWFSRCVLSWRLSNSMDVEFCLAALEEALRYGRPEIFNTDQGSQFTSQEFTGRLAAESIAISMDGKGRAIDNVMIERLWRTVKYENIYLKDYATGADCHQGLQAYLTYYCHERPHQSLANQTPWHAFQTTRRRPR